MRDQRMTRNAKVVRELSYFCVVVFLCALHAPFGVLFFSALRTSAVICAYGTSFQYEQLFLFDVFCCVLFLCHMYHRCPA